MTKEIWLPIENYEEFYEVSSLGRVRSKERFVRHNCGGFKKVEGRIISQLITPNGYCQVSLWKEGKRKVWLVHRLVLYTFLGACPDGMETRHLNSKRTDNRLINLVYGTHSENVIDTINLGRNSGQKLNVEAVKIIRKRLNEGEMVKTLAQEYNVSTRSISKIKNGYTYAWI